MKQMRLGHGVVLPNCQGRKKETYKNKQTKKKTPVQEEKNPSLGGQVTFQLKQETTSMKAAYFKA